YMRLLEDRLRQLLDVGAPPGLRSVAATFGLAIERLRNRSPHAAQLLELCSFFGPEPIPARLVEGASAAPSLGEELRSILADPIEWRSARREIGRFALARVDPAKDSLNVHRLVQDFLRASLTAEQGDVYRRAVQELLVAASPGDPEDPENW